MCDTMCALPSWSRNGYTLFAKNSDRPPSEPHHLLWQPATKYDKKSELECTYIKIPQVEYTYGLMMYKPAWCWGCEMGVNDNGVAIGNEAVFTKAERRATSLIGMDFVRLALERAENAENAIHIITQLLSLYGQGGQCGYEMDLFYDNSFLIADPHKGYLLETSGSKWAVRQFHEFEAISNELCINNDHIIRGGIDNDFDFACELSDPVLSRTTGARQRRKTLLRTFSSPPTVCNMIDTLRLHHECMNKQKHTKYSICMHPEEIGSNTANSLVAVLRKSDYCTLWTTGSSLPCYSMFKPLFLGVPDLPSIFTEPTKANVYWIKRENANRNLAQTCLDNYFLQRNALEDEWIRIEAELIDRKASENELSDFTKVTLRQEDELVCKYININL